MHGGAGVLSRAITAALVGCQANMAIVLAPAFLIGAVIPVAGGGAAPAGI